MTTNVIAFPNRKLIARSRNRKKALSVIIPRIKEIRDHGGVAFNGLTFLFIADSPGQVGTYFRVEEGGKCVMTGWMETGAKLCVAGNHTYHQNNPYQLDLHIMSWRRGDWEARLFA
jgi:hypothetical protein